MTILYILIPVAIVLVIIAICVFNWAVNSGQYDDLDSPAHSILFDEEDPAHLAARKTSDAGTKGTAASNEDRGSMPKGDRPDERN